MGLLLHQSKIEHLLLTSANSMSVMFLMISSGKVTNTDWRGRLHPSCKLIPKTTSSAKVQDLMMRCLVQKQKDFSNYSNKKKKMLSSEATLLVGCCIWVFCLLCTRCCSCFYTTLSLSHLTSVPPLTNLNPPTSS